GAARLARRRGPDQRRVRGRARRRLRGGPPERRALRPRDGRLRGGAMEPVRVAAMGIGKWAETLADAAQKAGTLRYVGGYARSADRRAAFVRTYGGRAYESWEALLADPAVEGVIITTPHSLHAEHIVAAAAAGKHVFVDKPFTLTVADARRATEACRRAGVVLALGHQRRRDAASRAIKRLVDEGALGRVAQVE